MFNNSKNSSSSGIRGIQIDLGGVLSTNLAIGDDTDMITEIVQVEGDANMDDSNQDG
ncbi:hypothetical protein MKX01_010831, partial [Papaver californicum]